MDIDKDELELFKNFFKEGMGILDSDEERSQKIQIQQLLNKLLNELDEKNKK